MMGRKTFILLMFVSLGTGYLFYHYVPAFWQLNFRWNILTGDDISKVRVEQYHEAWIKELQNNNIDEFVKEHQCTLSGTLWDCSYIVSDFQRFTELKEQANQGYRKISGWVEPMVLRQELQKFSQQERNLQENIAQLQIEIEKIEKKIEPRRKKIESIVQKRDLYQQNHDLRKRQIEIYEVLLPKMDPSSELFKVYSTQAKNSSARLKTIRQKIKDVDRQIQREASEWITLAEMTEKSEQWKVEIDNLGIRTSEYNKSLENLRDGKVAHPREYAFDLIDEKTTPIRDGGLLFPAFMTILLILSNLWIVMTRWIPPSSRASDDLTMVDMDLT